MVDLSDRLEREAALARKLGQAMSEARRMLLAAVEDGVVTNDEWTAVASAFQTALQAELENTYLAAGVAASEAVGVGVDSAALHARAIEWARQYSYELVTKLDETNRTLLQQTIGDYFSQRLTLADVEARLTQAFGPVRAEMIAITEVTRASAQGEAAFADELRQMGLQPVLVIYNAADELVCPVCGPQNGKPVSEAGYPPFHPRCVLPGTEIVAPGSIVAAAKAFYVGGCVEIVLSNGSVLTVTKNHPVLTQAGWVTAEFVREGDYAIYASDAQRVAASVNPDNDNVPTRIEDVFSALVKSSEMTTVRVPTSAEHFHGDGRDMKGDVDVVLPKRLLLSDDEPRIAEVLSESVFNRAGVGLTGLSCSGTELALGFGNHTIPGRFVSSVEHRGSKFGGGVGPSVIHGVGNSTNRYPGIVQSDADSTPRDAISGGKGLFGFASNVAGNNVGGRELNALSVAVGDPRTAHLGKQCHVADTNLAGEFVNRFPGLVAPNEVVKVRYFDVATHVYDLQVEPYSLYISNGVIVHNCRCWTTTELREATR